MRKLAFALSVVVAIFAMATGAYSQSMVAVDQLPIRTLSHVVGHDGSGHAGREPVTDFVKPTSTATTNGNIACWGTTASLIKDCGTPGSMAFQNSNAVAITGGSITGITDLAIADGGTGASNAADARTNLGLGTAATQNTGSSGHTLPFLDGVNTWSNGQTFPAIVISNTAGSQRSIYFQTANVSRWEQRGANGASEGGSNTGSDWQILRYNDAGTFIDVPLTITRSTGIVSLSQPLPTSSGGTGQTSVGTAISANTGTSGHVLGFLDGSNTWSAGQTISTGIPGLTLNASSGANSRYFNGTTNGLFRWQVLLGDNTAEGGSNAGSNFVVAGFNDAGSFLGNYLTINRATGLTSVNNGLTVTGATSLGATTATSINKVAVTAPATSATLTIANGTTLTTTSSTSVGQGQYLATATNDNATAGNIGEYASNQATATSLTSGTTVNSTSVSLTAGDWDVSCVNRFNLGAGVTGTVAATSVSTTSATFGGYTNAQLFTVTMASGQTTVMSPTVRVSISSTTTAYCTAQLNFSGGTSTVDGFIRARRVR